MAEYDQKDKIIEEQRIKLDAYERREAERRKAERGWWGEKYADGIRLLQAILDFIPEGLTISVAPDARIVMTSRHGADLLGRPTEYDEAGHPRWAKVTWQWLHPDGQPAEEDEQPMVRAVRKGETSYEEEWLLRRPDGKTIPILCSLGPMLDEQGNVAGGLLSWVEIFERKQMEERLRESEERFRATFEQAAVGMTHRAMDGRFIRVNNRFCEFLGYTADELLQLTYGDVTHPDDLKLDLDQFERLTRGEIDHYRLEKRYLRKGGRIVLGLLTVSLVRDTRGAPLYSLAVVEDITHRKQAEEALRESEARYRSFFEASQDAVVLTSPDGSILAANKAAQEMYGATEEELIEKGRQAFVDTADPRLEAFLEERDRTGRARGEFRSRRKDGSLFPTEVSSGVFTDMDGNFRTTTILRDITERKRLEEALHASEDLLSKVLDAMPVGVFIADKDGRLARVNPAGERIWCGVRHLPLDQLHEYKGWWADTGKRIEAREWAFARAFEHGEISMNEIIEIECFDGTRKTIRNAAVPVRDDSGRIISAIAVVEDITAERRAQQALYEREAQFRALVENSPDMIVRYSPDLRYLYVNPSIERAIGIPKKAFEGKRIGQQGLPKELQRSIADAVHAAHRTGLEQTLEWFWETSIGTKHFQTRFVPEVARSGNVDSVLTVSRDITSLKHLEEDLRKAKEAADEASRAKSQFLANMSHEIRTPMNGIMGMVELSLMQAINPTVKDYLMLAKNSARTLLSIINDILDLSKIEAGKLELTSAPFDLHSLLASTIEAMIPSAKNKGLFLRQHMGSDVPMRVVGDAGRLRQVLVNLIGNAIKFTERGEVAVRLALALPETACVSGEVASTCLLFSVRDTGIGIEADKVHSIFDSFVQVSGGHQTHYEGSGLGLAIAKSLVERMGGSIWVDSAPGRGSTFFFTVVLKIPAADQEEREEIRETIEKPKGPSRTILLAEDNDINRIYAITLLEQLGHHVTAVTNGLETLEALRNERFDLVLMDARMPEMDGKEATRRIRAGEAGDPKVPIVALTAYALAGDRERFLAMGMDDYLSKPIDVEELERVLKRLGPEENSSE